MKVTAHAVLRWLERIEGMDLTEPKAEMRRLGLDANAPREVLNHLRRTRGIVADDVIDKILTPLVVNAIRAGVVTVRVGTAALLIRNQAVVSVLSSHMKTSRGKDREEASP